jgi:hypothetical protein
MRGPFARRSRCLSSMAPFSTRRAVQPQAAMTDAPIEVLYADWLATRPESVQKVGAIIKPWIWYAMRRRDDLENGDSYGFAVYRLYSISEDGTVTVYKHERIFRGAVMHSVFGVQPDGLRALPSSFDIDKWADDFNYNEGEEK